jgi:WD40 repeat protein
VLSGEVAKLMSGAADGTVRSWDSQTGACTATLTVRESAVTSIMTCKGKSYVAGADGNVRVFVL